MRAACLETTICAYFTMMELLHIDAFGLPASSAEGTIIDILPLCSPHLSTHSIWKGKGKLVDILAQDVQLCARFNGGANAGHTLCLGVKRLSLTCFCRLHKQSRKVSSSFP